MFDEKGAVLSEEEATTVDSTVSHERQSKESPPLEPSIPSPVPTSASTSYKPALEDSSLPDNPITPAAESEQDEFRQEISTQNDIQNDHSATVTPTIFDTEPGRDVDEHGLPMDSTGLTNVAVVESPIIAVSDDLPVDSLPSGSILETELKSLDPSSVISPRVTGIELSGEDPSNIQEPIRPVSAILTPPVEVEDIFLSPPTMSPARNEPDSTTNDTTEPKTLPPLSIPSTRSAVRDSLLSQRSIDDPSPRSSYTESPGHLTVAHKISPITSRGVSIFLPGARTPTSAEFKVISEDSVSSLHDAAEKLQTETTPKLTASHNTEPGMTNTSRPAKKPTPMDLDGDAESDHEPLPERPKTAVPSAWSDTMSPPGVEFGTVIVGDLSKRPVPIVAHPRSFSSTYPDADFNPKPQGKNTSQTLNAVVYEKSRDKPAFQSATLPRSTPQRRGGRPPTLEDPMSPGFGDLLSLVAQSAILEQKLMNGEYPDEALPVKEMHEGPTSAPVRPSMGMEERQAKEAEDQEKYKELLRRRPSTKSMKGRGSSDSRRKPSFSLRNPLGRSKSANRKEDEAELGLGSAPAQANREHAVPNRSKSMFLTSSSQPSFSNVLPVPVIPSVVNDNSTSNNNNFTDEIPPTPPPKSPSARYLSSFRKFTSTRSQEDSVAVLTPPDNSPGFAGTGPLLQTRSRTQSANRPGSVINVPWPSMSPKKSQGSVSRATSFAGKMFRGRKKSNASTMSAFDADPSQQTIPELPSVLPPSPSLHELLMPETSLNSLHPPPSTPPQNGGRPQISTRTSWISTTSNDSSVRSPLLDQEFFDSFPSVPQTIPTPNTRSVIAGHGHSKEHSQGGVSFPRKSSDGYPSSYHGTKSSVHGRAASIKSTSTLGPHNAQMDLL
ncbi:hypothetical protein EV361DRAFT_105629 [Lentinula raphanica]|nr:hypothetical protein EV361DRAFT_105629 [Lentinula raphanica]